MNCSQCGADVKDGLIFCKQCGAAVAITKGEKSGVNSSIVEEYKAQGIQLLMRPTVQNQEIQDAWAASNYHRNTSTVVPPSTITSREIPVVAVQPNNQEQLIKSEKDTQYAMQYQLHKRYTEDIQVFKSFFKFMKDFIQNPLMDQEEMEQRLNTKDAWIYLSVLMALNTLISVVLMGVVLTGLKDIIDVVAYLMSNLNTDIHYLTGKIGLTFILGDLVMNIGHLMIFALLMAYVGSKVLKQDINWQDVCKYMLAPVGMLMIGKLPVILISILNVKLGIVLYILLVCMVMMISLAILQKRYGNGGNSLYSISVLYLLSLSINIFVGIKIMMIF